MGACGAAHASFCTARRSRGGRGGPARLGRPHSSRRASAALRRPKHIGFKYFDYCDEAPWRLADLVQEPQQLLTMLYDIGDHWEHVIRVHQEIPKRR